MEMQAPDVVNGHDHHNEPAKNVQDFNTRRLPLPGNERGCFIVDLA